MVEGETADGNRLRNENRSRMMSDGKREYLSDQEDYEKEKIIHIE